MNKRIAKKVLAMPYGHNSHQIVRAAYRLRPWWLDDGDHPHHVTYMARSIANGYRDGPSYRRLLRKRKRRDLDRHDWAWRSVEMPF